MIDYHPDLNVDWLSVFESQTGAGYQGYAYQRGSSGLGGLLSKLLGMVLPIAKSASRAISSEALSASGRMLDDIVAGRSVGDALKDHGNQAYQSLVTRAVNRINQRGAGGSRRKRGETKKSKKKSRKTVKKTKKRVVRKKRRKSGSKKSATKRANPFASWVS